VWQTITDGEGIHPFHIPSLMVRSMSVVSFTENPVSDLDTPPV